MKFRNIEDRLALVAALIVLVGVSLAAEDALAGGNDTAGLEVTAVDTTSSLFAGLE